jgi:hypothetical protein
MFVYVPLTLIKTTPFSIRLAGLRGAFANVVVTYLGLTFGSKCLPFIRLTFGCIYSADSRLDML